MKDRPCRVDDKGNVVPLYWEDLATGDKGETGYDPIVLAGEIYCTWLETKEPDYLTEQNLQEIAKKSVLAATLFHEEVINLMHEGE